MELLYKIKDLRDNVCKTLIPIIDNDYIFIDLPYYQNIGDVLIWQGSETFLKNIHHRCLYRSSFYTFDDRKIDESVIIIMQGGGNWGDIWHEHNDFRLKIVKQYPNNKIIILPQTIYYESKQNLLSDMLIFGKHQKLIVCARDQVTYDLLESSLPNCTKLLLPDMALFLDFPLKNSKTGKKLFFKRLDKEINAMTKYDLIPKDVDVHDWPTYENILCADKLFSRIIYVIKKLYPKFNFMDYRYLNDLLYQKILRKLYIKEGVKLLDQYDIIYSTRLHAAILGLLLGKQVVLFDNSYGKNKNFYNTWLKDIDSISLNS